MDLGKDLGKLLGSEAPEPPDRFEERVFPEELVKVLESRERRGVAGHAPETGPVVAGATGESASDSAELRAGAGHKDAFQKADDYRLFGLALSGGGIRSATFNLGLLQAMARLRLLKYVDYVSTVSGGGYIGSWLHAWVARDPQGIAGVERQLRESLDGGSPDTEPRQVRFLRRFSNYLTPSTSLFGADSWTVVTTYLRNLLLTQMALFTLLAVALLVPHLVDFLTWTAVADGSTAARVVSGGAPALVVFLLAFLAIGLWDPTARPLDRGQGRVQRRIVIPIFLAAYLGTLKLADIGVHGLEESLPWWQQAPFLLAATAAAAWAVAQALVVLRTRGGPAKGSTTLRSGWHLVWAALAASLGGAMVEPVGGLFGAWGQVSLGQDALAFQGLGMREFGGHLILTFGPPLCVLILSLVLLLQVALSGRMFSDPSLEWWSRLGAWLMIYSVAWMVLFGMALLGPPLLGALDDWIAGEAQRLWVAGGRQGAAATGLGAWLLVSVRGVLAARKAASEGSGSAAPSFVMKIAPHVFITGLLLIIALGVHAVVHALWADWGQGVGDVRHLTYALLAFGTLLFIALRLDINKYSMHAFYRDRLVRCYLGASNEVQERDNFTGFTPDDNEPLHAQARKGEPGLDVDRGPMPIINTALNLVGGDDLAWQERKAASFTFTPLSAGFQFPERSGDARSGVGGYRPAARFGGRWSERDGIPLGSCMAISGAAASPNMGFRSSPALTFLMTVFNVRLGWWVGNPLHDSAWRRRTPRGGGFWYLIRELLGLTTYKEGFCYVSDGGHFENLGIYELVRRRCRYIIASDAGQDGGYNFDDLGNAIRKCRTDFGVEIEIETSPLEPDPVTGRSSQHCAVGRILYPATQADGKPETGVLVYIKASLTGEEPRDVLTYASRHEEFPHQTTGDQWFGESQFESYRRLGLHIGERTFTDTLESAAAFQDREGANPDLIPLNTMFDLLRVNWRTPAGGTHESFTAHGRSLDAIFRRLAQDPDLAFLATQFYPEWSTLEQALDMPPPAHPEHPLWLPTEERQLRAGFYFCNSLFQLMENVYLDLDLEQYAGHPDNRGWMNLFKHWSWSGMFRVAWTISASTYGLRFQRFCERRLDMTLGRTALITVTAGPDRSGPQTHDEAGLLLTAPEVLAHLNFVERRRLEQFMDGFFQPPVGPDGALLSDVFRRDGLSTEPLRVAILKLELPAAQAMSGKPLGLAFTYGFAILHGTTLVYLRVQDHLRKMGFSRRALLDLIRQAGVDNVDFSCAGGRRSAADDRHFYRTFFNLLYEVRAATGQEADPPGPAAP